MDLCKIFIIVKTNRTWDFWKVIDIIIQVLKYYSSRKALKLIYKEGEGNRTKGSREEVEKLSTCRRAQSIPIRQVMVQCAPSWSSHPGLVILTLRHPGSTVEGQQISQSWDA